MPELPEVETVRNMLKDHILNLTITDVEVIYDKMIKNDVNVFINTLKNSKITDIERKGKYLIFILDNDYAFISHLRMEGKYYYENSRVENKHSHVYFKFENGNYLIYNDVRKFGEMILKHQNELYNTLPLSKLGEDAHIITSIDKLKQNLNKSKPIKTLLLEQENIAGLGNIYVDEVLFLSKIHPETKGNDLSIDDINNIVLNSKTVLEKSITLGGTTIRTFKSGHANGLFQQELLVHTKKGEKCINCGATIEKIKVNQRGTYFCPNCQTLK